MLRNEDKAALSTDEEGWIKIQPGIKTYIIRERV